MAGEGFAFLGYRFEAGQRHVRKKSLDKLKDAIRQVTRRTAGMSLDRVTAVLNMIRRRLRALLRKQEKRPGLGLCRAGHQRWPNTFFAKANLVDLHTAWLVARHPDEETTNWRAVCGKTARTVRRAGRGKPSPTPIDSLQRRA